MKVAFLAGQNSLHTVRWVNAMVEKVDELHLLTMHQPGDPIDARVKIHNLPYKAFHGYFLNVYKVRQILAAIKPDLFHVHYASGYGTLGRLSQFHPLLLSVWGSDVYDFPAKSFFHRALVAANLRQADWIGSTSEVMARQTTSLSANLGPLSITPFGIDPEQFQPQPQQDPNYLTIGTVKKLAPKYGIDILIKAFAQAREKAIAQSPELAAKLRLQIVGEGGQRQELEALVKQLNLEAVTTFIGAVPHREVPHYLNQMDIYVAASRLDSESFGVAILEASACGLPVVVSDAGGLPEVVEDGVTGYIAPKEDVTATATAITKLIASAAERDRLGQAGRQLVLDRYVWSDNVALMYEIYGRLLAKISKDSRSKNS
ncbi:MAG: glycosyltransferase [Cyanobacteria bacterium J06623_7]